MAFDLEAFRKKLYANREAESAALFDADAIAKRRKPVSEKLKKSDEARTKRIQVKNEEDTRPVDLKVYVLHLTSDEGEFIPFYVGLSEDPDRRFRQHLKAIDEGQEKLAYEFLRGHRFEDTLEMSLLGDYNDMTEAAWIEELEAEGYTLFQGVGGNDNVQRRRKKKNDNFKKINDEILESMQEPDLEGQRRVQEMLDANQKAFADRVFNNKK